MEKIGKSEEWPKLGVPNHFEQLWWEKWGMTKIEQSESFWITLVGKDWKSAKQPKLGHQIILDHFGVKRLEIVQNDQNWAF